jgi:hypothetical protein
LGRREERLSDPSCKLRRSMILKLESKSNVDIGFVTRVFLPHSMTGVVMAPKEVKSVAWCTQQFFLMAQILAPNLVRSTQALASQDINLP